jgi:hypothetical protein
MEEVQEAPDVGGDATYKKYRESICAVQARIAVQ